MADDKFYNFRAQCRDWEAEVGLVQAERYVGPEKVIRWSEVRVAIQSNAKKGRHSSFADSVMEVVRLARSGIKLKLLGV